MIETDQCGELFLVGVDFVDEFIGQNETILIVKVVVFALLEWKDLVVLLKCHLILDFLHGTDSLVTMFRWFLWIAILCVLKLLEKLLATCTGYMNFSTTLALTAAVIVVLTTPNSINLLLSVSCQTLK